MGRREIQKADTRRAILQAAYGLFEEMGYKQATMRELAERAGVGLGTIFKHFPDKPSILAAAFLEDVDARIDAALATLPDQGLKAQLLHVTRAMYEFYAQAPGFSRDLLKEVMFLEGEHGAALRGQVEAFLRGIAALVEQAVEQGEIAAGREDVLAFWSFYFTGLQIGLSSQAFDVDAQVAMVGRLVEDHFFARGGGS